MLKYQNADQIKRVIDHANKTNQDIIMVSPISRDKLYPIIYKGQRTTLAILTALRDERVKPNRYGQAMVRTVDMYDGEGF